METYEIRLYGGFAIAAVTVLSALMYRVRQNHARQWPRAEATVGSTSVGETTSDSETVWYVRVSYSFTVNGDYFGGLTDRIVSSSASASELAPKLVGKTFPVRYKQSKPDTSVVLDDEWVAAMNKALY
ncbi:MAG TPA: DUF3592 domain-containing protein [Bryobacteraceae bacterium]|jgi:hypothetical protein